MTINGYLPAAAVGLVIVAAATPSLAQRADEQTTGARVQALRECNAMTKGYRQYTWGAHEITQYRTCMNQHNMQNE